VLHRSHSNIKKVEDYTDLPYTSILHLYYESNLVFRIRLVETAYNTKEELPLLLWILQFPHLLLTITFIALQKWSQILYLDLKVCDNGTLVQILRFWTLSIVLSLSKTPSCLYFKTQRFGDWILSPSLVKTYSVGSNQ
jgi:hypothetical protein